MILRQIGVAIGIAATSLIAVCAAPAAAADASAWSQDSKSALRLIKGENKSGEALRAGIEVKLQPGWHTYWRYPGDSGVPPRFSFAGSDNIKSATVSFPAPVTFVDGGGTSIGYRDSVVFPLAIVPKDPAKPVIVRLRADYAVCEKLCIPAEGKAELPVGMGPSTQDADLAVWEAQVPKPVDAAAIGLTAKRVNDDAKPLIAVEVKAEGEGAVQLYVEGPSASWALPIPKPAPGAPTGFRHFGFELDGLPPGLSPKGPFDLTFTVVQGGRAVEATTRLD